MGKISCGRVGTGGVWLMDSAIDHKCGNDILITTTTFFMKISFQNADEVIICPRTMLICNRSRNIFMDLNPRP